MSYDPISMAKKAADLLETGKIPLPSKEQMVRVFRNLAEVMELAYELERQRDELKADAERYRWLREQNETLSSDSFVVLSRDVECPHCESTIDLNPGEHYAGLIVGKNGEPSYHLVLLPGEAEKVTFAEANEWAGRQSGEYEASLPTSREQALLYANLKEQFQSAWYWSSEAHASAAGYAWCQYFFSGYQLYDRQSFQLRARAVRRVVKARKE